MLKLELEAAPGDLRGGAIWISRMYDRTTRRHRGTDRKIEMKGVIHRPRFNGLDVNESHENKPTRSSGAALSLRPSEIKPYIESIQSGLKRWIEQHSKRHRSLEFTFNLTRATSSAAHRRSLPVVSIKGSTDRLTMVGWTKPN